MRDLVLKVGIATLVFGVFGLALSSGLPDIALIAGGFTVAIVAIWLGLRRRSDGPVEPGP